MNISVFCDRWIRTQFPLRAQQICKPRKAIYAIFVAIIIDCLLHIHLLTPLFGPVVTGPSGSSCGANRLYPTYVYFYSAIWPVVSITTVTFMPATMMILFVTAITINIQTRRNRVAPVQQNQSNGQSTRQTNFVQRQMFIMMMMTLVLFFVASLPVALYRFVASSLGFRQSAAISLVLTSTLGMITASNYALNFYLHCLTSKLYRKEFRRSLLGRVFKDTDKTTINVAEGSTMYRHGLRTAQKTLANQIRYE